MNRLFKHFACNNSKNVLLSNTDIFYTTDEETTLNKYNLFNDTVSFDIFEITEKEAFPVVQVIKYNAGTVLIIA